MNAQDNNTDRDHGAEVPATSPRKHIVESAAYWFNSARQISGTHAVLAMEYAYNHVENALADARDERDRLSAELTEANLNAYDPVLRARIQERDEARKQLAIESARSDELSARIRLYSQEIAARQTVPELQSRIDAANKRVAELEQCNKSGDAVLLQVQKGLSDARQRIGELVTRLQAQRNISDTAEGRIAELEQIVRDNTLTWCEECNFPLSACGELNPDGTPSDDCLVCQLRSLLKQQAEAHAAEVERLKALDLEWQNARDQWGETQWRQNQQLNELKEERERLNAEKRELEEAKTDLVRLASLDSAELRRLCSERDAEKERADATVKKLLTVQAAAKQMAAAHTSIAEQCEYWCDHYCKPGWAQYKRHSPDCPWSTARPQEKPSPPSTP